MQAGYIDRMQPAEQIRPTAKTESIGRGAADHLLYIRNTIDAARTFTTIPGKGCIAMGGAAIAAATLEAIPALSERWLPIWLTAAVLSAAVALFFMEEKARSQGLSLRRTVATRFFLTLAPAFVAGGILTVALGDSVGRDVIAGIWLLLYGVGIAACGVYSIPVVLIAGLAFMGFGTVALAAPASWAPYLLGAGFGLANLGRRRRKRGSRHGNSSPSGRHECRVVPTVVPICSVPALAAFTSRSAQSS